MGWCWVQTCGCGSGSRGQGAGLSAGRFPAGSVSSLSVTQPISAWLSQAGWGGGAEGSLQSLVTLSRAFGSRIASVFRVGGFKLWVLGWGFLFLLLWVFLLFF